MNDDRREDANAKSDDRPDDGGPQVPDVAIPAPCVDAIRNKYGGHRNRQRKSKAQSKAREAPRPMISHHEESGGNAQIGRKTNAAQYKLKGLWVVE